MCYYRYARKAFKNGQKMDILVSNVERRVKELLVKTSDVRRYF